MLKSVITGILFVSLFFSTNVFAADAANNSAKPPVSAVLRAIVARQQALEKQIQSNQINQTAVKTAVSKTTQPAVSIASTQTPSNQSSSPKAIRKPQIVVSQSSSEQANQQAAFQATLHEAVPMTPAQIEYLRLMLAKTQAAAANAPGVPPQPTSTSQFVSLSPGTTPPVVRLSSGFVTSLVFLDNTGANWPIASYDLGNPKAFNVQWNKKSSTLMVQALTGYTYGNLAVTLRGLSTPIMITLVPGQKAVDYRVDMMVQKRGPNAKPGMPNANSMPAQANSALLNVLDGVPPRNSKVLTTNIPAAQAWENGNKLFLRSRYNVLSPAWYATMSSGDGTHAYEMPITPVVLLSVHGKAMPLRLEGF